MAKLPVCLFVLLVLGTILNCEAIFLPLNNLYQHVTVTKELLQDALIETVNLPGDCIAECKQAAATAGLDAFVFDGSCTGYKLVAPFLSSTTGSLVVLETKDKFAKEYAIINLDDYPYENTSMTYRSTRIRKYMMSSFIEPEPSNWFYIQGSFEEWRPEHRNFITRENNDTFIAELSFVDFRSCLTNSTDGVPILVGTGLYSSNIGIGYFLNECGNTIQVSNPSVAPVSYIYPHEGQGCVDNPNEVPDECKVTFEPPEGFELAFYCVFSDPKREDGCPGFNMTVTGSSFQSNETETASSCTSADSLAVYGYSVMTVTLLKHRSTPKSGFVCFVYPL